MASDFIDQRGSFAAAAQALHKVPSALTYTIQKVEQDLEIKLFDRSGHRAKLTPAGKLLLDQGRLILRDIDSLAQSAQKISSGWEAELTICVDTLFEASKLLPLVTEFNNLHPHIRINLTHGSISGTWEQLLNQSADLIISSENTDPKLDGYEKQPLGEVQLVFAVSNDHPLAENACDVTDEMIEEYPVIVVPDSTAMMTPMTVGWTKQNRVISVPTMTEKIAAQKSGLGVGYLPKHRIEEELADKSLIPLKIESSEGQALAAWRKGTTGPALKWFIEHVNGAAIGLN